MAAADTKARSSRRQLPITGSAHKAGNGRRPLPAATAIARSARPPRRGNGSRPARGGAPAGPLLSRRLHPAGCDGADRVPEQGRRLRPLVADRRRDAHHHRRRPEHLGARIGLTAVLHTWGSALTHHPHVHVIVPGGGLSPDGRAGSPASPASSCPCACCRASSAASSSKASQPCMPPAASPSSATSPRLPKSAPSTPSLRRYAALNGSSTPRGRSPDRKPFSPISRATPTASRSPIRG